MGFNTLNLLIVVAILIVPVVPTLWALVDLPRRRFPSTTAKVVWFAVVSALPCIGAILYIALARRTTQPEVGGLAAREKQERNGENA